MIYDHFTETISTPSQATLDFNWDLLNIPRCNLNHLDDSFSEEEVRRAILQMPTDKAPGPDGFTGNFFKHCWGIIKGDLVITLNTLHDLRCLNLDLLNSANIILIPKKKMEQTRLQTTDRSPSSIVWQRFFPRFLRYGWRWPCTKSSPKPKARLSEAAASMTTSCSCET